MAKQYWHNLDPGALTPIGRWVREKVLVDPRDFSISEIAKRIGISGTYMHKIIHLDDAKPSLKIIMNLGLALNDIEGCLRAKGFDDEGIASMLANMRRPSTAADELEVFMTGELGGIDRQDYFQSQFEIVQNQLQTLVKDFEDFKKRKQDNTAGYDDIDLEGLMEFRPVLLLDESDKSLVHQLIERLVNTREVSNNC